MSQPIERNTGDKGAPLKVSFEFFPPKTEKMEEGLWRAINRLAPLQPNFVSVTYGADGSTRERTHNTVARILKEASLANAFSLRPAAHLTCVSATRAEVDEIVHAYWELGVRHLVALRGDPQSGIGSRYEPHPQGYANAAALVAGIRKVADFEISVSAYPEKHPESATVEADLDMLQAKVDAGANRAITQFFFDNDLYFRYLDRVRGRGITVPVTPGIIPIHNFKQISAFTTRCGAHMPSRIARRFEGLENDPETMKLVAATVAAEQVMSLAAQGVREFHFYTLNRADLVYAICHLLGLRPAANARESAA